MSAAVQNDNWDRLGELVARLMQKAGVPGVCVGILHEVLAFPRGGMTYPILSGRRPHDGIY
jgi:hypothetical protein